MSKEKIIFLSGLVVAIVVAQVVFRVLERKTPVGKI